MKLVLVKWKDSTSYNTGWARSKENDYGPAILFSVGFVLEEDDDRLVLTGSTDLEEGNMLYHSPFVIPKVCIVEEVPLTKGETDGNIEYTKDIEVSEGSWSDS